MASFILYETSSGYALFERIQAEVVGMDLDSVQQSILDLAKFGKMIKLKSFIPFKTALEALENANDVSEGICNPTLKSFLELNIPSPKGTELGVGEKNLAGSIKADCGLKCVNDETVTEIIRGIRYHGDKLLKQLSDSDLVKSQLGLGHSYSRAKVKFNVHRSDNMIIQAISLLDQLDKDINTFSMRVREWYSWHFPELANIVKDNGEFAQLAKIIGNKSKLTTEDLDKLTEITNDEAKSKQILDAARASMGTDISEIDLLNIETFAVRVIDLVNYRKNLSNYLSSKMDHVAPNLAALIGDSVGARLIAHAGSLTNLSKYPASTVQILGAEKALFRALKTRGNTPKYGLIYHSSFIGRAGQKNKGRISRFLANKCSMASRLDCFLDTPTRKFGDALKKQVENRLEFYESGATPLKNEATMEEALKDYEKEAGEEAAAAPATNGKRSAEDDADASEKKSKKEKKDKKDKKDKKEKKDKKDKKSKSEK
ncbi:NOP56 protein [Conidiobolus coronatus NRRL 28638]|uniref:Nucleolar protein 56 n=1 Tax=Conidiobolus coronatus (strain ATCC 28846 / CBS 209.66 / NRRL 28638) TaxID=796925 RepID=A0A137PEW2_CONC2|nr:NOP56 protein [Conidiobolus coronatus NRRL 28638]|eukprot:KXN73533.1 NOP56 protein [Conidiobolus coronatus NRRL 28638]